jgi:hypothetical protein
LNYANVQSFNDVLKSSNIFKNNNFSSSDAIKILRASNPADGVITFRQADLIHSIENPWLDNFDPRFAEFLELNSAELLHADLLRKGYKYIHVPPYTWPTIYRTAFQELLANPKFSVPLVPNVGSYSGVIDKAQLFRLNDRVERFPKDAICVLENPKNFKLLVGQTSPSRRIASILTGIPLSEEIAEVKEHPAAYRQIGYWLGATNYVQLDRGRSNFFPRSSIQIPKNFQTYSIELVIRGKGLVYVDAIGYPFELKVRNLLSPNLDLTRVYEGNLDSFESEVLTFQFRVQDLETVRFRLSTFDKYSSFEVRSFKICGYGRQISQIEKVPGAEMNSIAKNLLENSGLNCQFGTNSCEIEPSTPTLNKTPPILKGKTLTTICNFILEMGVDKLYRILCKSLMEIPSEYLTLAKVECVGNCLDENYTLYGIDPSGISRILPIIIEGDSKKSSGVNFLPTGKWSNLSVRVEKEQVDGKLNARKSITVTEATKNGK